MKFNTALSVTWLSTPLGQVLLAATNTGLAGLWFEGQRHMPDLGMTNKTSSGPPQTLLAEASQQVDEYFQGLRQSFNLPLDLSHGTPFQQSVWRALLDIAPGCTISYGHLAERLGHPNACRAVGAAVARNPVSIVVPCHRVVGSSGQLTGYAGGLDRKHALLMSESNF